MEDRYKRAGISEEFIPHLETCQAIAGDRNASVYMWEMVAKGCFDDDVKTWLMHLADAVLDAESKPAGVVRDRAIKRAVGLEGNADKHRGLREVVHTMVIFGYAKKTIIETLRGNVPSELWIGQHLDPDDYKDLTDNELRDIVDSQLKKVVKPS